MGLLERTGRGRLVVLILVLIALAGAVFATWFRLAGGVGGVGGENRPVPGDKDHVVIEVINTTSSVGLARSATRRLRDAGIDVVFFAADAAHPLDSTLILVRRGDPSPADKVRKALGAGLVRVAPDSTRLVDVTVRLGRDFAAVRGNP